MKVSVWCVGEDPRISFLKLITGSENRPGLKLGLELGLE